MTTNEAIERVARLKPNAVRDGDIADWILDLNGRLLTELHIEQEDAPRIWPEDGDKELLATEPYAELYVFYAVAMIEFYQREYSNYNNTIVMFNDRMADYRRWYRRENCPEKGGDFEGVWW